MLMHLKKKWHHYVGVNDAVAVSSGTAAIHLALQLLDVEAGDRVFCSTLTFVASANPILYQGANRYLLIQNQKHGICLLKHLERALKEAAVEGNFTESCHCCSFIWSKCQNG